MHCRCDFTLIKPSPLSWDLRQRWVDFAEKITHVTFRANESCLFEFSGCGKARCRCAVLKARPHCFRVTPRAWEWSIARCEWPDPSNGARIALARKITRSWKHNVLYRWNLAFVLSCLQSLGRWCRGCKNRLGCTCLDVRHYRIPVLTETILRQTEFVRHRVGQTLGHVRRCHRA